MKTLSGKVISDRMTKAVIVEVEQTYQHPMYGKFMKRTRKLHALNDINAKTGDQVLICETRPVSKTISFRVEKILTNTIKKP